MRILIFLYCVVPVLLMTSCVSKVSPERFERSYNLVVDAAEQHLENNENTEAYALSLVLLDVNPVDETAFDLKKRAIEANGDLIRFEERPMLGSNYALRESRNAGAFTKVLLWPVNFVTDFLDIFTIEVGVCIGAGAKVQITEALSAGAQFSAGNTMIGFRNRHIGTKLAIEDFIDFLPVQMRVLLQTTVNTGGLNSYSYGGVGLKKPSSLPFQRDKDYWAVGAEAQAGLISANVKVHPFQLWDWFAGLLFIDTLNDNIGSTRGLHFEDDVIEAVKLLRRAD